MSEERKQLLAPDDHTLSMRISPRARRPEDNEGLRSLLVKRLTDTHKAVGRISLRGGHVSFFCEPCAQWLPTVDDEFVTTWTCPNCRRSFEMEFAVMEEVNGPDGQG